MDTKIRWAKVSDVKAIAMLFRHPSVKKYFGRNEYPYRFIKEWIKHYPKIQAIAIINGEVVGFISLYNYLFNYMTGYEHIGLLDVVVDPKYQEKGIGSLLVKFAIEHYRKKGFKKIEVCVEKSNKNAVRFFEGFGFKKEGTLIRHHNKGGKFVDDFIMGKLL